VRARWWRIALIRGIIFVAASAESLASGINIYSEPATSMSMATNGEGAEMFSLGQRSRAKQSRPSRAPRQPLTATGWYGAPTVRNGRFPPRSLPSGIPNSIQPQTRRRTPSPD